MGVTYTDANGHFDVTVSGGDPKVEMAQNYRGRGWDLGYPKDPVRAAEMYEKTCKLGHEGACQEVKDRKRKGAPASR